MKSIGRRLLSFVCAVALVGNGVAGVMAQDGRGDGKAGAVQTEAESVARINADASEQAGAALQLHVTDAFSAGLIDAVQQGGGAFQFFSREMSFDNRLVKDAPFSADIVSETIQTLPDGNRIVQRVEGRVYRDSQGRTRNERTFYMGGSSEERRVIDIIDPVTASSYSLDPETRIARRSSHYFGMGAPALVGVPGGVPKGVVQSEALVKVMPVYPSNAMRMNASGEVEVKVTVGEDGRVISATAISGHPLLRSAAEEAARKWVFKPAKVGGRPVQVQSSLRFIFTPSSTQVAETGAETSKGINVSGGVLQGKAIRKVQPSYPPIAKAARASGAVQVAITISETGEVIEASVVSGHPLLRDAALQAARQWAFKPTEIGGVPVKVKGILTFNFTLLGDEPAPAPSAGSASKYATNTEQLGKRMIEGVECEGARAVTTIPAGAIGNERPIETVTETWRSPELQMMILSKRSDPRFGESTYRVTNIIRSEPDASLFQVPPEYTIIDRGAKRVEIDVKTLEELQRRVKELTERELRLNKQ